MTIQGWVLFGILALFILSFGIFGAIIFEKIVWKVLSVVAAMLLIIGLFAGMRWYYQNTASGQRAMTDQKSELDNGLERLCWADAQAGQTETWHQELRCGP